VKFAK
jgi:hypothetical protein